MSLKALTAIKVDYTMVLKTQSITVSRRSVSRVVVVQDKTYASFEPHSVQYFCPGIT